MFDEPHHHLFPTFKENYHTRFKEAQAAQRSTPSDLGQQARVALTRHRLEEDVLARAKRLAESVRLTHPLGIHRSDKKVRLQCLHNVLVAVALGVREVRGQERATSITIHTVVELIAFGLGWGRTATTHYLDELESSGLVARRAHVTTTEVEGEIVNRCDGVILNVENRWWCGSSNMPSFRLLR